MATEQDDMIELDLLADVDGEPAEDPTPPAQDPELEAPDDAATAQTEPEPEPEPPVDIDWDKVDPSRLPHEVVEQSPAFRGILSQLQQIRATNAELMETVRQGMAGRNAAPAAADPEYDPEESITRGEFEQRIRDEMAKAESARQEKQQQADEQKRRARIGDSERALCADPKLISRPPTLRPGNVLAHVPDLQQTHPALVAALLESDDPAKELYNEVIRRVPAFHEAYVKYRKQPKPTSTARAASPRSPQAPSDRIGDGQDTNLLASLTGLTPAEAAAKFGSDDGSWMDLDTEEDQ